MDREIAPSERRRRVGVRVMVTAVPVLILALLIAWLPDLLRPGVARARIRTARITTGPVDAMIMAAGTVVPEIERVLASPVDARVLRILKLPGARVERGDAVVELDTSESVLALDKLQSNLRVKENEQAERRLTLRTSLADVDGRIAVKQLVVQSAEARLAGDKTLVSEGLLSRDAFRQSELALTQARIELEQLRAQRDNSEASTQVALDTLTLERGTLDKEAIQARRLVELSTTKSDRAGVVTWALSQEGAVVRKGDVIARLADLSTYRVDATVSDVHAGRLHAGMPAVVLVNEQPMAGTVASVYPTVENGVVRFTVALAEPARAGLRPSLRVDVHVITDHKDRTLRVARGPFVDDASRRAFVVRGDRAVRVALVLGIAGVDLVEVVSGASEGDELIVSDMRDYLHLEQITLK
ncbi:MAG: HlyD family efflux transporter periplasmic adaptor subunit [Vicinamibacteraceae bacterium]